MQYELQVFHDADHREFRTITIDGEPWFVLADVCRALEMADKKGGFGHHAERLDDDEKRLVPRSALNDHPPVGRAIAYGLFGVRSGLKAMR